MYNFLVLKEKLTLAYDCLPQQQNIEGRTFFFSDSEIELRFWAY